MQSASDLDPFKNAESPFVVAFYDSFTSLIEESLLLLRSCLLRTGLGQRRLAIELGRFQLLEEISKVGNTLFFGCNQKFCGPLPLTGIQVETQKRGVGSLSFLEVVAG